MNSNQQQKIMTPEEQEAHVKKVERQAKGLGLVFLLSITTVMFMLSDIDEMNPLTLGVILIPLILGLPFIVSK